ncbi:hypothetical protein [Benzoatithermus flavus]|uniref:Peptidase family M23 n=1 Tax=Benzoatithermus flavus TaxID=3108223 RepID=A0ABU8XTC8_9PROT
MRVLATALLATVLALPQGVSADEITDQIDQARHYYDQGDIPGAVSELEFALQALRGKIGEQLLATFPEPPAGWRIEDPGDQSRGANPLMGAGTMLSRTYRSGEGDGEASIEAQLMAGSGFLQGLAGMLMNPQVLAAQPNAKRVRIGRDNAVVTYDAEDKSAQLVIDLGGKGTIMLQGHNVKSGDPLVALANKWDLRKVKELLGS